MKLVYSNCGVGGMGEWRGGRGQRPTKLGTYIGKTSDYLLYCIYTKVADLNNLDFLCYFYSCPCG